VRWGMRMGRRGGVEQLEQPAIAADMPDRTRFAAREGSCALHSTDSAEGSRSRGARHEAWRCYGMLEVTSGRCSPEVEDRQPSGKPQDTTRGARRRPRLPSVSVRRAIPRGAVTSSRGGSVSAEDTFAVASHKDAELPASGHGTLASPACAETATHARPRAGVGKTATEGVHFGEVISPVRRKRSTTARGSTSARSCRGPYSSPSVWRRAGSSTRCR